MMDPKGNRAKLQLNHCSVDPVGHRRWESVHGEGACVWTTEHPCKPAAVTLQRESACRYIYPRASHNWYISNRPFVWGFGNGLSHFFQTNTDWAITPLGLRLNWILSFVPWGRGLQLRGWQAAAATRREECGRLYPLY